jgi:plastocyanin
MEFAVRRSLLAAIAAAAALAFAGCGDDDETDTAAEDTGDTAAEEAGGGATVAIGGVEYAFEPSDATVDEAGPVTVEFTNDGEVAHALEIEELEESTDTIDAGESTTLDVELEEGDYTIYCPVGDHRAQGMEGTLTVGGGGGGASGGSSDDSAGESESESETESESESEDDSSSGGGAY